MYQITGKMESPAEKPEDQQNREDSPKHRLTFATREWHSLRGELCSGSCPKRLESLPCELREIGLRVWEELLVILNEMNQPVEQKSFAALSHLATTRRGLFQKFLLPFQVR